MFLKMMKCELISLLVFQTVFAAVNVNINNFELEYFVTYDNWCKSDKDRFQFIIGISIKQCVVECGARVYCSSLNYRNQINGCELFLTSETEQPIPGECVYVKKENINVTKVCYSLYFFVNRILTNSSLPSVTLRKIPKPYIHLLKKKYRHHV
jgi:hypothetical protein